MIAALVAFLCMRNARSFWCRTRTWDDWRRYLVDELEEVSRADDEQINAELGDLLILVLSIIAKHGDFENAVDCAFEKLQKRCPNVLRGETVSFAEELRLWDAGK